MEIIKLSESPMSAVGIEAFAEGSAEALPEKPLKIEFIGDSITCGYGVDDEDENHQFTTATEDVTKAYAYKTAKALDAEYSMFSASGYGIVSGYTEGDELSANRQFHSSIAATAFQGAILQELLRRISLGISANIFRR